MAQRIAPAIAAGMLRPHLSHALQVGASRNTVGLSE
jgi:hypothetical protein